MAGAFMLENSSYFYDLDSLGDSNSFPFYGDIESLRKPWITTDHFVPTMIVYGLAFLVGVIGNGLVLTAVLRDKKSRSVTTSFMVSLAIADVLFLCVCVPYEATKHVIAHWALGPILCKISEFIKMLSAVASILNLSSVSVERKNITLKSRRKFTKGVLFHQDNAPVHNSVTAMAAIHDHGFNLIEQ
ncbi:hypothetical protein FSP39_001439 [Pinctada imbricata]|uniref:G-protein coupled receptors family 1 profile domain-containing protein n=1 Tax=Pinctada imbricata TaxID=66713 RepID=A0AA89BPG4_PINIB|nr:hypothetical protein FSP39_001439 [Pinctada imbricata]